MRTYFFILLVLVGFQLNAQTLQTVTNSGSTTTNQITTGGLVITGGTVKGDFTNAPILTSKDPLGVNIQQVNIGNDVSSTNSFWSVFAHNTYNNGTNWIRRNHHGHTASLVMNNNGFTFNTGLANGSSIVEQPHTMTPVMSILNNGYVGIGITNPSSKLQVNGVANSDIASFIENPSSTVGAHFTSAGWNNVKLVLKNTNGGAVLTQINTHGISYFNGNDAAVGIGTASPSEKLDVVGRLKSNTVLGGLWLSNSDQFVGADGPERLGFWHNGAWRFIVQNNGNVLIGKMSSNPGTNYKLDVAGNIRANKLVVNTTGADFVFDSNYSLLPLTQLEQFIKKHKHLPSIEPAKNMQENGVDIGENQTKLLQKIEELTLYIIEINKKLENQNNLIQQQQLELNKLKKKSSKQ